MKCALCREGETKSGYATVTLHRGSVTVIIKDVPADICDSCGEYYLDEATTKKVLTLAEDAVLRGAEVEILRWAA